MEEMTGARHEMIRAYTRGQQREGRVQENSAAVNWMA